jgi:ABC-type bacteriocin/lantibiotic exporter with double-glycine peptidase domain
MESKLTPMQRFWLLLKPDKKEIRNVYVYAVFLGLVNLSLPIGIQSIINIIQGGQISTSWIVLVIFVMAGVAFSGILQIYQLRITEHLQQKIFTRAAFEFTYRIPKIKLEALYKHYAPELMNRFFDVVSIQKGLSKILIDFSTASIQAVFGLLLLSLYHPFFIIFSLVLILLVFAIFKLTSKKGLSTSLQESKSKYTLVHWLQELARTSVSFKLAGHTDLPLERTNNETNKYLKYRDSHFKVLLTQYSLMVVFKVIVAAGLLIVGSILVMDQKMNIGQFVAAEIIIILVMGAVEKLILSLENIYDVLTSLEKVGQVTDLPLERNSGMDITKEKIDTGLKVELCNVTFNYPEQKMPVLNDICLTINPNENIILMGDSDSGKTTLLYLLASLYKIKSGNILFNEIPMGNLNPHHLRSIIGDCLMDELLFEGTIIDNITMGREKATFENAQWAVENLGLKDFIKSLPQGYDTYIHPQGRQFSKGIVDKLILARSIADKPKLLLIKDAFSSLVGEERLQIFDFLADRSNNWTMVISSKDKQIIDKMDRTIIIENGSIINNND